MLGIIVQALLLQAMAIMLYRSHSRRLGELFFTLLTGFLALIWFTLPFIVPVIQLALLGYLVQQSRAATWRIA